MNQDAFGAKALELACHYQNRCCEQEEIIEMFCLDAQAAQEGSKPLSRKQVQEIVINVCDVIYPQDGASYSEADSVFYGAFVNAIEAAHGIRSEP